MRVRPTLWLCCLGLLLASGLSAQLRLGIHVQRGGFLPVEPFLRGENRARTRVQTFSSIGLHLGAKTRGNRAWHHHYRLPERGVGLRLFGLDSPHELGRPLGVFYYFNAPLLHPRPAARLRIAFASEIGLAAGFRKYDYARNPYNDLMSTRVAAYLHLSAGLSYPLSDRTRLGARFGLSHFSNGNLRQPNAGLNALALDLSLTRRLGEDTPTPPPPTAEPYSRTFFELSFFGGVERVLYYPYNLQPEHRQRGIDHGLGGLNMLLARQLSVKSRFGLSLSFTHRVKGDLSVEAPDGYLVMQERPRLEARNVRIGIAPSYELLFGRVGVQVQAEYLLRDPWAGRPYDRFRQKLGLRYRAGRVSFGPLLNARHFSKADYIEWHVGWWID